MSFAYSAPIEMVLTPPAVATSSTRYIGFIVSE